MYQIAQLLEIPGQITDATISALYSGLRGVSGTGPVKMPREHRQLFSTANRVPGVAAALRRESMPSAGVSRVQMIANRTIDGGESSSQSQHQTPRKPLSATAYLREGSAPAGSSSPSNQSRDSSKTRTTRSRDGSPRMPRPR